jgi:ABC-2 type transport system permease protein
MTKYWTYLGVSFKAFFTYKADFALSICFNMIFFFIFLFVWKSVYGANSSGTIANYTLSGVITYYLITSLIYRTDLIDSIYLGQVIWNGDFTNDLIKPWNAYLVDIIATISDVMISLIIYTPFFTIMIIAAHDYIIFPSLIYLGYFIITLLLAFIMNLWINYILHALTFYWGDQEPNIGLINYIIAFFAGGYFPLAFLPAGLAWFKYLPFRFLFDVPANIFLQKLSLMQILSSWGQMLIWIVVFYLIFLLLYKNGLKRYTGTGR